NGESRTKSTISRVDIAIVPWAAWLYLLNYLDRTNMGAVKIANADTVPPGDVLTELKLNDGQRQLAISIFFVGYGTIFEVPSNIILTRVGPSKWMSRIIVSWGICAMCLAFCSNYAGILACRLFLGIAEAGFFPGMMLYFSFWYTQREYAVRASLFYCSANLGGAFGGLLAYGISFMNVVNGWSGWRWIFLFEGIPSIICGLLTWFILPDYPLTAEFLTPIERTFLTQRLPPSASSPTHEHYTPKTVLAVLLDPHAYIMNCLYLAWAIAAYAFTFWLPTIVRNLGFSSTQALLMTTPPFFAMGVTWSE
ncbi:MFS general substrate transporter, partial [Gonapodya prolifera JEL478]